MKKNKILLGMSVLVLMFGLAVVGCGGDSGDGGGGGVPGPSVTFGIGNLSGAEFNVEAFSFPNDRMEVLEIGIQLIQQLEWNIEDALDEGVNWSNNVNVQLNTLATEFARYGLTDPQGSFTFTGSGTDWNAPSGSFSGRYDLNGRFVYNSANDSNWWRSFSARGHFAVRHIESGSETWNYNAGTWSARDEGSQAGSIAFAITGGGYNAKMVLTFAVSFSWSGNQNNPYGTETLNGTVGIRLYNNAGQLQHTFNYTTADLQAAVGGRAFSIVPNAETPRSNRRSIER